VLIPTRERGFEHLDDPALPAETAERSLQDVALSNKLFGGTRAVLAEMQLVCEAAQRDGVTTLSLLDVGTGLADIPAAVGKLAARFGIALSPIGIEPSPELAHVAHKHVATAVAGDGRALPFAGHSIDVVTCSQVLHHFTDSDAQLLLRECTRVARRAVIIAEIRRSWLAIILLWLVSFPLRFHAFSRHDGVASIRRGFTVRELALAVQQSGINTAHTRKRFGWRVTAIWHPGTNPS
jgi:ubiquinone/menaquinone biosynthesis C-methylase UbiE